MIVGCLDTWKRLGLRSLFVLISEFKPEGVSFEGREHLGRSRLRGIHPVVAYELFREAHESFPKLFVDIFT